MHLSCIPCVIHAPTILLDLVTLVMFGEAFPVSLNFLCSVITSNILHTLPALKTQPVHPLIYLLQSIWNNIFSNNIHTMPLQYHLQLCVPDETSVKRIH